MGKLIAKIEKFEIRQNGRFEFVVNHEDQGQMGMFRTEQRCRDLVDMFTNPEDWR